MRAGAAFHDGARRRRLMDVLSLFAYGPGWGDELLAGLRVTIGLAVLSYVIGLGLGLAGALGELSRIRLLPWISESYAAALRSVPELLVVFLIYFGGSFALRRVLGLVGLDASLEVSAFWAGVGALSLVQGAYTSEVFRGAVLAVPHGVIEAAQSLGMGRTAVFRLVVLPLALRYAFPGLCNMWMVVIKNTPFVSAIGLEDLIRAAGTAGQNTKHYFLFFFAVLLTYLLLSGLTMIAQSGIERRIFRHLPAGRGA